MGNTHITHENNVNEHGNGKRWFGMLRSWFMGLRNKKENPMLVKQRRIKRINIPVLFGFVFVFFYLVIYNEKNKQSWYSTYNEIYVVKIQTEIGLLKWNFTDN